LRRTVLEDHTASVFRAEVSLNLMLEAVYFPESPATSEILQCAGTENRINVNEIFTSLSQTLYVKNVSKSTA
jgi:hypothetical protein